MFYVECSSLVPLFRVAATPCFIIFIPFTALYSLSRHNFQLVTAPTRLLTGTRVGKCCKICKKQHEQAILRGCLREYISLICTQLLNRICGKLLLAKPQANAFPINFISSLLKHKLRIINQHKYI